MRHLGFDEPGGYVQVQTARLEKPGEKSNWRPSELGERWYRPDQLAAAWAYASWQDSMTNSSGAGREAFISAHRLLDPSYGRKKSNAAPVRALWCDIDDGDVSRLKPTALIETSPGRYQGYWRLNRWIAPHTAEELNKRLARFIGGDSSGFDLTQVLRLPELHNWSRPGYPIVHLVYIDDELVYDVDELEHSLPPLPTAPPAPPLNANGYHSADDSELIAMLGQQLPVFGRLYAGDTTNYTAEHGQSDPDWGLAQDLLRATGGDQERVYRLMRASGLERDKWNDRRGDVDYLQYTIARAAKQLSPAPAPRLNASAEPQPTGAPCTSCTQYRRQIDLMNQLVRSDLPPIYKLVVLYLMTLVGFAQARGQSTVTTQATRIGRVVHASAQSVRPIMTALARSKGGELLRENGLFDLRVTREYAATSGSTCGCSCHASATRVCPACRNEDQVFSAYELGLATNDAYTGFLEAALHLVPDLPSAPKRSPRVKEEPVDPPPIVEPLDCPAHPMTSREVVCATCGTDLIAETRYVPPLNANGHRSEHTPRSAWTSIGAIPQRSAVLEYPARTVLP